jgi:hypothetical protein
MPTALSTGPYRFYFYAYDCNERRHMHVDRDNFSAKFWLEPEVTVADNHGYSRKELRTIERIIHENIGVLRHEWDSYCSAATNIR